MPEYKPNLITEIINIMKIIITVLLLIIACYSAFSQYTNRVDYTEFIADLKVTDTDSIQGEWKITLSQEWFGYNKLLHYVGETQEVLHFENGAYRNNNMMIVLDYTNRRFVVKTEKETFYLTRKEDRDGHDESK